MKDFKDKINDELETENDKLNQFIFYGFCLLAVVTIIVTLII
jgi:hypothetical protein